MRSRITHLVNKKHGLLGTVQDQADLLKLIKQGMEKTNQLFESSQSNNISNHDLEAIEDLLLGIEPCELKVVGFGAMDLFISDNELSQRNKGKKILQNGIYQLPIYCQKPPNFEPETLANVDRFPCSSLLVRVFQAPVSQNALKVLTIREVEPKEWEKYGLWQPGIQYSSGSYNNKTIKLSDNEKDLFRIRQDRHQLPIKFFMKDFMQNIIQDVLTDGHEEDFYEEDNADFSHDQIVHFLDKYINIERLTDIWSLSTIDLKYFNKYNPESGVKHSVDSIGNFDFSKGFPFCVSWVVHTKFKGTENSVFLDFMRLKDKKENYLDVFLKKRETVPVPDKENQPLALKTFLNVKIDWEESTTKLVSFAEDYIKIGSLLSNQRSFILTEIYGIKWHVFKEVKVSKIGWTALPLFLTNDYCNSDFFQLPVIHSKQQKAFFDYFMDNVELNAEVCFKNFIGSLVAKEFQNKQWISSRLVDYQRDGHFSNKYDYERINKSFIPANYKSYFALSKKKANRLRSGRKLQTKILLNQTPDEFTRKLTQIVQKIMAN